MTTGSGYDVEEVAIRTEADEDDDVAMKRQEPPGRRPIGWALTGLAAVALVIGVITWVRAADHDQDAVQRAALRDTVLLTARSHIETMNTLDHRDVDGGLERWQDISTGTLKDQIASTDTETRQLMADQQMVSTGKVVDAAVLDLTDSTATVIASVEVTVRDDGDPSAPPSVKRNRFAADLVRVGDRWLLEGLDQVAVEIK